MAPDTAVDSDLLKIGAAAERLGIPIPTLKYWVARGWLTPAWTSPGKTRYFAPADLDELKRNGGPK